MKGLAPYHLPEVLPPRNTIGWHHVEQFVFHALESRLILSRAPRFRPGGVLLVHPSQHALIDLARSLHNGEVEPAEDAPPPPRVWRLEVEWQVFWLIEADRHAAHRLLCWDREQRELAAA